MKRFVFTLLFLTLSLPQLFSQQSTTVPAPAVAPAGQQPGGVGVPYAIHRNVSLVVLDGVALDAKGKVVTDLSSSDFHVAEDGVSQKIRDFETPGTYTPSANLNINSTEDLDRLAPHAPVNIVLLDEFTTRFEDMAFGRYSLKKWLEKQPGKLQEPTMLIAVDLQHFTVLCDYTQDKDKILSALDRHFAAYPWQAHQYSWVAERYATAFNTLRRVAEATNGHAGHKNMIWIGRGFPTIDFAAYPTDAERQVHTAVQLTVDELRDARVTLYTIDPSGLMVDPGKYGQYAADFEPFGGDADFEGLARATGGRTIHGRNDVDTQIDTAIQDGANLYTLTYTPSTTNDDPDKFRHISVTIDRPGVTFLTRKGYYPAIRPAHLGPDGQMNNRLAAELINAADSNMAYDSLGFVAEDMPGNANTIRILVQSKGLTYFFTDGTKPRFTRVIVVSSTFDAKNKHLKDVARTYTFIAPKTASPRGHLDLPVMIDYKLDPNPKTVRVRLVVRVDGSGHTGTAEMALIPGTVTNSAAYDPGLKVPSSPKPAEPPANP